MFTWNWFMSEAKRVCLSNGSTDNCSTEICTSKPTAKSIGTQASSLPESTRTRLMGCRWRKLMRSLKRYDMNAITGNQHAASTSPKRMENNARLVYLSGRINSWEKWSE